MVESSTSRAGARGRPPRCDCQQRFLALNRYLWGPKLAEVDGIADVQTNGLTDDSDRLAALEPSEVWVQLAEGHLGTWLFTGAQYEYCADDHA